MRRHVANGPQPSLLAAGRSGPRPATGRSRLRTRPRIRRPPGARGPRRRPYLLAARFLRAAPMNPARRGARPRRAEPFRVGRLAGDGRTLRARPTAAAAREPRPPAGKGFGFAPATGQPAWTNRPASALQLLFLTKLLQKNETKSLQTMDIIMFYDIVLVVRILISMDF